MKTLKVLAFCIYFRLYRKCLKSKVQLCINAYYAFLISTSSAIISCSGRARLLFMGGRGGQDKHLFYFFFYIWWPLFYYFLNQGDRKWDYREGKTCSKDQQSWPRTCDGPAQDQWVRWVECLIPCCKFLNVENTQANDWHKVGNLTYKL